MSNLYRLDFADGSSVQLRGESCADAAASAEEGHGRILVKVERLPDPEPVKAVLFVPVGRKHGREFWYREGNAYFLCYSNDPDSIHEHYRRVGVDLRKAIYDAITGYNERCRMNPRLCAKTLADEIAREIEGGA